jgi:hypothetical protein
MKDNWLYRSIMGADETTPARPIPKVPIIDDPQPLSVTKPTAATEALIDQLKRDAAIEAICGSEVLALLKKNPALQPADPRAQPAQSTLTYDASFPDLPKPVGDPRKPVCDCGCRYCRTQDHRNCDANPRCEFAHLGVLDDILPASEEIKREFQQAAMSHQQERLGKSRLAKHKGALAPAVSEFRTRLVPYSARVPDKLWENLANAMAADVATGLATL